MRCSGVSALQRSGLLQPPQRPLGWPCRVGNRTQHICDDHWGGQHGHGQRPTWPLSAPSVVRGCGTKSGGICTVAGTIWRGNGDRGPLAGGLVGSAGGPARGPGSIGGWTRPHMLALESVAGAWCYFSASPSYFVVPSDEHNPFSLTLYITLHSFFGPPDNSLFLGLLLFPFLSRILPILPPHRLHPSGHSTSFPTDGPFLDADSRHAETKRRRYIFFEEYLKTPR